MADNLLFAINCKLCKNEFVYCIHAGNDFRCYECKKKKYTTVEDIEKELREMPKEEFDQFMQEIREYEEEYGKIIYDEDEEDDEE
jgi:hypothetical protein